MNMFIKEVILIIQELSGTGSQHRFPKFRFNFGSSPVGSRSLSSRAHFGRRRDEHWRTINCNNAS